MSKEKSLHIEKKQQQKIRKKKKLSDALRKNLLRRKVEEKSIS
jgi:hypothetical protein